MTVYNDRKLHRTSMSDGFLADNVGATLASLQLYNSTTAAVFGELHDQCASLERRVADALSLW